MDKKLEKKIIKSINKRIEDEAWENKANEYGHDLMHKYNVNKFYELEKFWPNFWSWVCVLWLPILLVVIKLVFYN